jgi:hypothetical protein
MPEGPQLIPATNLNPQRNPQPERLGSDLRKNQQPQVTNRTWGTRHPADSILRRLESANVSKTFNQYFTSHNCQI